MANLAIYSPNLDFPRVSSGEWMTVWDYPVAHMAWLLKSRNHLLFLCLPSLLPANLDNKSWQLYWGDWVDSGSVAVPGIEDIHQLPNDVKFRKFKC